MFSSLMKMIVSLAEETHGLNKNQLIHSLMRNFGGLKTINTRAIFEEHCKRHLKFLDESEDFQPPTEPIKLVEYSITGNQSRYFKKLFCSASTLKLYCFNRFTLCLYYLYICIYHLFFGFLANHSLCSLRFFHHKHQNWCTCMFM